MLRSTVSNSTKPRFLYLVNVEKYGFKLNKTTFSLQKNSLLSKWSQLEEIISITTTFEPSNEDILLRAIDTLKSTSDLHDSPHFRHIISQLHLLLTKNLYFWQQSCSMFFLLHTRCYEILVQLLYQVYD